MEDRATVIALTVVGVLALQFAFAFWLAGMEFKRISLAWSTALRIFRDSEFAGKLDALVNPPPPKPEPPPKPNGAPLRLLALLQREGRLLDFLLEDVQAYSDEQIGSAVRDIHRSCQGALQEHLVLEPVLPQPEGSAVDVPAGFDPSAIRLVGNVTGQPPFKGTLQHHGWRVKQLKLTAPPEGQDEFIVMPAEVELA